MSEQKYYVKLKPKVMVRDRQDERCGYNTVSCGFVWLDRDSEFSPSSLKYPYTKSELAEIMDGALYREPFLGETGIHPEWINPLIELVPAEEED